MTRWRQFIVVRGASLQMLQSISNLTVSDDSNTLVMRGHGDYFPTLHGIDWAARCGAGVPAGVELSDIAPILLLLLESTPILFADCPADDEAESCEQESGQ